MNWYAALFFLMLGIAPALISYRLGLFSTRQLAWKYSDWTFSSHWGAWYDIFVLPWVLGHVWHYLIAPDFYVAMAAFLISLMLAAVLHVTWTKSNDSDHNISLQGKLTVCGWIHFVYTVLGLYLIILYSIAHTTPPGPARALISVGIIGIPVVSPLLLELHRYKKLYMRNVFYVVLVTLFVLWRF